MLFMLGNGLRVLGTDVCFLVGEGVVVRVECWVLVCVVVGLGGDESEEEEREG